MSSEHRIKCGCGALAVVETVPRYGTMRTRCECGVKPVPRIAASAYVDPPVPVFEGVWARDINWPDRECRLCGTTFTPQSVNAATCSTKCRKVVHAAKALERYRARRPQSVGVRCLICRASRANVRIDTNGHCGRCRVMSWHRRKRIERIKARELAKQEAQQCATKS